MFSMNNTKRHRSVPMLFGFFFFFFVVVVVFFFTQHKNVRDKQYRAA